MSSKWNCGAKRSFARALALGLLVFVAVVPVVAQLQPVNLQATDQVDAIAIVVTRFGPYPNSFTHPATPFLLSIVNRSGTLEDTFSLVKNGSTAANSLLDLHSTSVRQRDHQIIKPVAGSYQLLFRSHPDWVVNVTITAQ
jgi:hypothetical protein